jgi:galactokinase
MRVTLQDVYDDEADAQRARYESALELFTSTYGPGVVQFFRAPGRVNLIGEHTDYNHGFVMPVALDRDILLLTRPRSDSVVRASNIEESFGPFSFTIARDIPPGPPGDWGNYAKGAAQELARRLGRELRGFDGLFAAQPPYGVPRGVGLSSSSAVTVVAAVALARLNDWQPDAVTMAQLCSEAEWYVGTRGGIMDQFISLLGQRDHALFLDCRPDVNGQYSTEQVPLPERCSVLIADSGVRHQNVRGEYNHRVAACRAGVRLLQARYPGITHLRDVQDVPWGDLAPVLPEETKVGELMEQGIDLGDLPGLTPETLLRVRPRCRHVWTENQRVEAAMVALRAGDVTTLGRLLNEAHASARDDYEISCPELESLVETAREVGGVIGARLTGAGWGGCIVAVVRDDAVETFEAYVSNEYPAKTGKSTAIFACRSAPGAGECSLG